MPVVGFHNCLSCASVTSLWTSLCHEIEFCREIPDIQDASGAKQAHWLRRSSLLANAGRSQDPQIPANSCDFLRVPRATRLRRPSPPPPLGHAAAQRRTQQRSPDSSTPCATALFNGRSTRLAGSMAEVPAVAPMPLRPPRLPSPRGRGRAI